MIEVDRVEPTRIAVRMGFKRNMGNYENLDIAVEVASSAKDNETAEALLKRVYDFTESRLEEKFQETEAALREAGLGG